MIEPIIGARRRLHPCINFRRDFRNDVAVVVFLRGGRRYGKEHCRRYYPREKFLASKKFHVAHPFREDYIKSYFAFATSFKATNVDAPRAFYVARQFVESETRATFVVAGGGINHVETFKRRVKVNRDALVDGERTHSADSVTD